MTMDTVPPKYLIGEAFEMAVQAHSGQTDKSGRPYIEHVLRVSWVFHDQPEHMTVALLHDVVEDTDVSLDDLVVLFGKEIADAVDALTKRTGEDLDAYLERVKAHPVALAVKLSDVADNSDPKRLSALPERHSDRLTKKYQHCVAVLNS